MSRPRLIMPSEFQKQKNIILPVGTIVWKDGMSKRKMNEFARQERQRLGLSNDFVIYRNGELTKSYFKVLKEKEQVIIPVDGVLFNPKTGRKLEDNDYNRKKKLNEVIKQSKKVVENRRLNELQQARNNTIIDYNTTVYNFFKMNESVLDENNIQFVDKFTTPLGRTNNTKVYVQVSWKNEIVGSKIVELTDTSGINKFFKKIAPIIYPSFHNDSDALSFFESYIIAGDDDDSPFTYDYDSMKKDRYRVWITKAINPPPEYVKQVFRKDVNGLCVRKAIRKFVNMKFEEAKSSATRSKWASISRKVHNDIAKITESEQIDGINEDQMEDIAKLYSIRIDLYDLFGQVLRVYNDKARNIVRLTNTAFNHVDLGYVCLDNETKEVSAEAIDEKIKFMAQNDIPFLANGMIKRSDMSYNIQATKLCTDKMCYVLKRPEKEIFAEMNKINNIRSMKVDVNRYPELNQFLKDSVTVHSSPVLFHPDGNEITEYTRMFDIKACYTQVDKCRDYQGFFTPKRVRTFGGIIADKKFLHKHLGIYRVKLVSFENHSYLKPYELSNDKIYILPSPEILMLMREGACVFKLLDGAFCFGENMDIEYTNEIMESKLYTIWAGKLGRQDLFDEYIVPSDNDYSKVLSYSVQGMGGRVDYFNNLNMAHISIPRKHVYTTHHMFSQITSYARCLMVELMKDIVEQGGSLNRVILDGVYFEDYEGNIEPNVDFLVHTDKELKQSTGSRKGWFNTFDGKYNFTPYNPDLDAGNRIYLTGQGGSGKTHSICTDKGIIGVMYVAPQLSLVRETRRKYGVNACTYAKMLGNNCRSQAEEFGIPFNILCDESTQMDAQVYQTIEELYGNSCIIVAGDISMDGKWFQTRNGNPVEGFSDMFIPDDYHYVHYDNDYRSLDTDLMEFKLQIRKIMEDVFTDGGKEDTTAVMERVKLLPLARRCFISKQKAIENFKTGQDIWICGTHKTQDKLNGAGIISGYRCKKTKAIYYEPTDGCDKYSAFTIHSFQGITRETGKIYISQDLFEFAMMYTAISRARYIDQIKIVF